MLKTTGYVVDMMKEDPGKPLQAYVGSLFIGERNKSLRFGDYPGGGMGLINEKGVDHYVQDLYQGTSPGDVQILANLHLENVEKLAAREGKQLTEAEKVTYAAQALMFQLEGKLPLEDIYQRMDKDKCKLVI